MTTCDQLQREGDYGEQTLERVCITVGNTAVTLRLFRLWVAQAQYYAELSTDSERCCAYLGERCEHARSIFRLLVKGGVTPCTLYDIVNDLHSCCEFFP